jgi:protein-S-isoprenylcysteine O-methyltransferase Ste14
MFPGEKVSVIYRAIGGLWLLWVISWVLAAGWSARTVKTTRPGERTLERLLTAAGVYGLILGGLPQISSRIYSLSAVPAWLLVALVACGFAVCWWARLHLGLMWSMDITLKNDHQVIDTGPYSQVRHPIYTGLLLAAWATAAADSTEYGFAGAALMTLGIYLKARREEQLLSSELGAPYESYRRRVPMLLPRIAGAHRNQRGGRR